MDLKYPGLHNDTDAAEFKSLSVLVSVGSNNK
jgi:hypothetical protein